MKKRSVIALKEQSKNKLNVAKKKISIKVLIAKHTQKNYNNNDCEKQKIVFFSLCAHADYNMYE